MRTSTIFLLLLSVLILHSCKGKTTENPIDKTPVEHPEVKNPTENPEVKTPVEKPKTPLTSSIPNPEGYDKLGDAEGDLDKDGIPEKVIVYNTPFETDFGTARQVLIFKLKDNKWQEWHVSDGGVLPSEHGGMMGDPFESVRIERGCIVFEHFGGSRWKWTYVHRFRHQNDAFELIGTTITNGAPCEYFEEYDYNLSSGKIIYRKQIEPCDDNGNAKESTTETAELKHKLPALPKMTTIKVGETELAINGSDKIFYF